MKPPPKGWPRMSASVFYGEPRAAIDWLCRVFSFEVRLKVEGDNGEIHHSELSFEEAVVMVGGVGGKEPYQQHYRSPRTAGGVTHALAFYIDDVDAHHAHALEAGATIVRPLETNDYGAEYWADRTYGALDLEGHLWWFIQRMRG
jgi:uncharacterized glyoxalase superfamily protein PhnB